MTKISTDFRAIPDLEGYTINEQGIVHDKDDKGVTAIRVGDVKKFRLNVDGEVKTFKQADLLEQVWGEDAATEEVAEEEVEESVEAEAAAKEDAAEEEEVEEEAEEEVEEEVEEEKAAPKKAAKKATKKAAPKKESKPGIIVTIFTLISEATGNGISEEEILKQLVKTFKDKNKDSMANTIKAQIGSKKRPCRMEKERKVTFKVVLKKEVRHFAIK